MYLPTDYIDAWVLPLEQLMKLSECRQMPGRGGDEPLQTDPQNRHGATSTWLAYRLKMK